MPTPPVSPSPESPNPTDIGQAKPTSIASSTILNSLQSLEQLHLLNEIDKLRTYGVGEFVSLPQIVVCGDQSSGKSSVLEAITEIPFPRKDNLCTRFATQIVLRRGTKTKVAVRILPDSKRPEHERKKLGEFTGSLENLGDLPLLIEDAHEAMGVAAGSAAFSRDVLSVEISGPERPQLTVVDLPGLTHTENKSQSLDDVELVSELVYKYMSDPRTIVLAIVTAKNDYANQIVLKRAKEVDPSGVRTLGIITKPDTLPEGSDSEDDFFSLAKNEDIFFELGWHVLRNRAYEERDSTSAERNRAETSFFEKGVWRNLPRECVGISTLRSRLSALLLTRIKKELPRVYKEISNGLKDCKTQLSKLGQCRSTVYEQRVFLSEISETFVRLCKAATDGIYEEEFFGGVTTTEDRLKRLRAVIQRFNISFANQMQEKGHSKQIISDEEELQLELQHENDLPQKITKKAAIEWVKPLLVWSRGRELPGTYNPLLIGELFLEQSRPWESLAYTHLEHIFQICQKFLEILLREVAPGDMLDSLFSYWINKRMQERFEKASSELKSLLTDISRHAITYNHYYTENIQGARQARLKERYIAAISTIADWNPDVNGTITLDPAELLKVLTSPNQANMDDFACEEVLDGMSAFYKVATKVFIDNVAIQVVERQVVSRLWEIFSPSSVVAMTAEMISSIAEESVEDHQLRKRLEAKLKSLQMGMEVCRGTLKGITADGTPSGPSHGTSLTPTYLSSITPEELGALLADTKTVESKEGINKIKCDTQKTPAKPSTTLATPKNQSEIAASVGISRTPSTDGTRGLFGTLSAFGATETRLKTGEISGTPAAGTGGAFAAFGTGGFLGTPYAAKVTGTGTGPFGVPSAAGALGVGTVIGAGGGWFGAGGGGGGAFGTPSTARPVAGKTGAVGAGTGPGPPFGKTPGTAARTETNPNTPPVGSTSTRGSQPAQNQPSINWHEQAPITGPIVIYAEDYLEGRERSYFQSINFDVFYRKWSFEELRLKDYETGKRWGSA